MSFLLALGRPFADQSLGGLRLGLYQEELTNLQTQIAGYKISPQDAIKQVNGTWIYTRLHMRLEYGSESRLSRIGQNGYCVHHVTFGISSALLNYLQDKKTFEKRSEKIQLLITSLLVINVACRVIGVFMTPFLVGAGMIAKYTNTLVSSFLVIPWAAMFGFGFFLGPWLRQLIEKGTFVAVNTAEKDELQQIMESINQIEEANEEMLKTDNIANLNEKIVKRKELLEQLADCLNKISSSLQNPSCYWKIRTVLTEKNGF